MRTMADDSLYLRRRQLNCADSRENYVKSVSRQNNNRFQVGTSKNKNIDHRVKKTCAIMSTQVTYETYHIPVLCHSTMSNALIFFCFLCILL